MDRQNQSTFPIILFILSLLPPILYLAFQNALVEAGIHELVQLIIFGAYLFLIGIPHGALDHFIDSANKQSLQLIRLSFFVKYLGLMIGYAAFWLVSPQLSLIFFIAISAWHFGETDIVSVKKENYLIHTLRITHGLFVLLWILLLHFEESLFVIKEIVGEGTTTVSAFNFLADYRYIVLGGMITLFVLLLIIAQRFGYLKVISMHIIFISMILMISIFLPLLLAFIVYFGAWHSLKSLEQIIGYLKVNSKTHSHKSMGYFYIQSMPFTILSFVGMFLFYFAWDRFYQDINPIPIVFIFIAILTLPHVNILSFANRLRMKER
ncbi:MAG: Brp/Blh family beta-carotene 15,15'-dioxygenase [Cyclobacteriaceae bacterium]|nr:Brp/Blh family beta-carotene 15,15'-dioxygenase [Cyclobacteriaceae bacterium]MCH8517030.1 Brp/Blh family beta-carotene 15,15'-dioxygenase [Cyclobacteriaceae bacterium]